MLMAASLLFVQPTVAFIVLQSGTATTPPFRSLARMSDAPQLPRVKAAVIVPGFLSDESDFAPLAKALTLRGIPTVVAPMKLWHWLPVIGGRSVRPVLERIDHAVRHVAAQAGGGSIHVPPIEYGILDLWSEFWNNPGGVAAVGGTTDPSAYPIVSPRGRFPDAGQPAGRIALIGHSAGGYIARIYCSERAYGGKAYCGCRLVHSIVTLGTPHAAGSAVPFVHVEWANQEPMIPNVDALAVGASGTPGDRSGALTQGAYSFCTATGTGGELLDGDGITPTESSIAWPGANTLVLPGVTHYPWTASPFADLVAPELTQAHRKGKPWYGDDVALDKWVPWLEDKLEQLD